MIGLGTEAELGPFSADDALHDAVPGRVAFADTDRCVAELPEHRQVLVVPAVCDVLSVHVERTLPGAVDVTRPVAVSGRFQEEARVAERLELDHAPLPGLHRQDQLAAADEPRARVVADVRLHGADARLAT